MCDLAFACAQSMHAEPGTLVVSGRIRGNLRLRYTKFEEVAFQSEACHQEALHVSSQLLI